MGEELLVSGNPPWTVRCLRQSEDSRRPPPHSSSVR